MSLMKVFATEQCSLGPQHYQEGGGGTTLQQGYILLFKVHLTHTFFHI